VPDGAVCKAHNTVVHIYDGVGYSFMYSWLPRVWGGMDGGIKRTVILQTQSW